MRTWKNVPLDSEGGVDYSVKLVARPAQASRTTLLAFAAPSIVHYCVIMVAQLGLIIFECTAVNTPCSSPNLLFLNREGPLSHV